MSNRKPYKSQNSGHVDATKALLFEDGTPRIASERERKLWLDGWNLGYADGEKRGRRLQRDVTRKRAKRKARGE